MTLVSAIISAAYRESNILSMAAPITENQNAEALALLNSRFKAVFGNDVGYRLRDWIIANPTMILDPSGVPEDLPFVAQPQSRLVGVLTAATTVDLDPQAQDGQRLAVIGNFSNYALTLASQNSTIEGNASKVITGQPAPLEWFYRADIADWTPITTLALGDTFPLPTEFDDYFIIALAARLDPRYGRTLPPESVTMLQATQKQLAARYTQTAIAPSGAQPGVSGS